MVWSGQAKAPTSILSTHGKSIKETKGQGQHKRKKQFEGPGENFGGMGQILVETWQNLVVSYRRCLESVIANKGFVIDY